MIPLVAASEVGVAQSELTLSSCGVKNLTFSVNCSNLIGKSSHRR